jgi:hypothetical protein
MKKIGIGLVAVVLAISAFAFGKADKDTKFVDYYWFQTQDDGTVINATAIPPFQATDHNGCSINGVGCSKAYTGYQQLGPSNYAPSGTLKVSHRDN